MINQYLLDAGFDTISCDELCEIMEADGYRKFLDAEGRTIWRGVGLRSDKTEEQLATPEDLYPVVARSTYSSYGKLMEAGVVNHISSDTDTLNF